jgi:hypothetical protein
MTDETLAAALPQCYESKFVAPMPRDLPPLDAALAARWEESDSALIARLARHSAK